MERRQALGILGTGFAAVAGCLGWESRPGSPAADGTGTTAGADGLAERQFSRFQDYDPAGATLRVTRDDVQPILEWDQAVHIAVAACRYPRGEVLRRGVSEAISAFDGADRSVHVEFDDGPVPSQPDEHLHYVATVGFGGSGAGVAPGDGFTEKGNATASNESATADTSQSRPVSRPAVLAETDRLVVEADGALSTDPHPVTLDDESKPGFRRTTVEGAYHLELSGEGVEWAVPVRVFKAEYASGATGWHGHDYPTYVDQARASGLGGRIGRAIHRAATVLYREPLTFAIEVVQRMPYVAEPDTRADEYIKYPAETLVEGGGDCEDSALLLGSLLTGPPFDRDCAIVHPPNHVGLGLAAEDYVGTYYPHEGTAYFFVETTAPGWDIGELPEQYASDTALVFPV